MQRAVAVVIAAVALSLAGCDKKRAPDTQPTTAVPEPESKQNATSATLVDLSTSLAAAREAFNAREGEARFLTLLSPT